MTDTKTSFLQHLSPDGREILQRLMIQKSYAPGENIIAHEDQTAIVYFVLDGVARATIFSPEGKMIAYRDIGPGEIFGELAAIDDGPRSASVIAVSDLRVGAVTRAEFSSLVESTPEFTWALLRHLSGQVRVLTGRIYEFSTMVVRERLAQELLRLAAMSEDGRGQAEIDPAPTHFELASRISTHREAVSRELSRWTKLGLLDRDGTRLIVRDVDKLKELVGIPENSFEDFQSE